MYCINLFNFVYFLTAKTLNIVWKPNGYNIYKLRIVTIIPSIMIFFSNSFKDLKNLRLKTFVKGGQGATPLAGEDY